MVPTTTEYKDQLSKSITTTRNVRDVCASIFIPGMIGLLTIAIAIVQLHIASQQRQQDLAIAEANRLSSLTIAKYTREQDLLIANTLQWDAVFAAYVNDISMIITNFTGSVLQGANLQLSNLHDVSFHEADLKNVNFAHTLMSDVDFSAADLRGSNITDENLQNAYSILGAILPNNTLGSNPMLLPIHHGGWNTIPYNSIGTTMIESSVAEHAANIWIQMFKQRGSSDGLVLIKINQNKANSKTVTIKVMLE
ncbi:unnamed protein product [Rotaria sordida]|uniref:Pentapeptide repeat-containing protein n=1 Tax=Rotaria sordida TaxID=392033 RepID=A0A815I0M3_9BILA|nr:unnamed protein product [Rotaria sordida]CAF1606925.1 unnamed protein product [Rotaria sordida]